MNLHKLTLQNTKYRKSIYKDENMELVLYSLGAKQEIPSESHDKTQFIRVEQGIIKIYIHGKYNLLKPGHTIVVIPGVEHKITTRFGAKFNSIYL